MRRVVVLPQPEGPTRHDDLALGDLQGQVLHRGRSVAEDLLTWASRIIGPG